MFLGQTPREPTSTSTPRPGGRPTPTPTSTPQPRVTPTPTSRPGRGAGRTPTAAATPTQPPAEIADAAADLVEAAKDNSSRAGISLSAAVRAADPDGVRDLAAVVGVAGATDAESTGKAVASAAREDAGAAGTLIASAGRLNADSTGKVIASAAREDAASTGRAVASAAREDADSTGKAVASAAREDPESVGNSLASAAEEDPGSIGKVVARAAREDAESTGRAVAQAARANVESTGEMIVQAIIETRETNQDIGTVVAMLVSAGRAEPANTIAALAQTSGQSVAIAAVGRSLPTEIWVPEQGPEPGPDPTGEGFWCDCGSPAPIERVLTKFASEIPQAHVAIADVLELPPGVPEQPNGRIVNSVLSFTPENFEDQDVVASHVTFFVEKSWLEANQVHQWSLQFSRFDEDSGDWVPSTAKRVREDEERVYFSVVLPAFSIWSISGSPEATAAEFLVEDLAITPDRANQGQPVIVSAQVTNLTDERGVFNAVLWLNSQVSDSTFVDVPPNVTVPVSFSVRPMSGTYEVRIDRLLGSFTVQVPPSQTNTPSPILATPTAVTSPVTEPTKTSVPAISPSPVPATATRGSSPVTEPARSSVPTVLPSPVPATATQVRLLATRITNTALPTVLPNPALPEPTTGDRGPWLIITIILAFMAVATTVAAYLWKTDLLQG